MDTFPGVPHPLWRVKTMLLLNKPGRLPAELANHGSSQPHTGVSVQMQQSGSERTFAATMLLWDRRLRRRPGQILRPPKEWKEPNKRFPTSGGGELFAWPAFPAFTSFTG